MFNRKLGIIDFSKNKVTVTETPKNLMKHFLGGRGLNSYYLHKMLKKGIDPLSPDNVLIFATSNRRHLMPEYAAENREAVVSPEGELHPGETAEVRVR